MNNKSDHNHNSQNNGNKTPGISGKERLNVLMEKTMRALKRDYVVVGKQQIEVWRFGLLIGVVAGLTAGLILVANRSGRFESGMAAQPITITAPLQNATVFKTFKIVINTNLGTLTGVQVKLDGANLGPELPKAVQGNFYWETSWDTITAADGTHVLTAVARDSAGNLTVSDPVTVIVNNSDQAPPVISGISAAPASDSAFITWTTNEPADAFPLEYGISTAYGQKVFLGGLTSSHSIHLPSLGWLRSNTLYHYRVTSRDKFSNPTVSSDFTFTTASVPNLIGNWRFDAGDLAGADYSGNNNTASFVNGPTFLYRTVGVGSNVLNLDGVNDYADIKATGFPAANKSQTIALWAKYGAVPSKTEHFVSVTNNAAKSAVYFGFKGGMLRAWKYGGTNLISTTAPSAGAWHHYAYTFNGTTHALYVDGVQKVTSTIAPNSSLPNDADIGRNTANLTQNFTGQIDDVRIYNKTLSASDIGLLYNATNDITTPSQVTGLTATAVSGSQISLSWSTATDNIGVVGYAISRNGAYIATLPFSKLSYQDSGLNTATTYKYRVSALDAVGNSGAASSEASATTKDDVPPAVSITTPADGATVGGTVTIDASASDNIGVTEVEFTLNDSVLQIGFTTGAATSPYAKSWDTTKTENGEHTLTVTAKDAAGNVKTASITVTVENTLTVVPKPQEPKFASFMVKGKSDFYRLYLNEPLQGPFKIVKGDFAPLGWETSLSNPICTVLPIGWTSGPQNYYDGSFVHDSVKPKIVAFALPQGGERVLSNQTYTLTCTGSEGTMTDTLEVYITNAPQNIPPLGSVVSTVIPNSDKPYTCKGLRPTTDETSYEEYNCAIPADPNFTPIDIGRSISSPIWFNNDWHILFRYSYQSDRTDTVPYCINTRPANLVCDPKRNFTAPALQPTEAFPGLPLLGIPPKPALPGTCANVTMTDLTYWMKIPYRFIYKYNTQEQEPPNEPALRFGGYSSTTCSSPFTANEGFYPAPDATGAIPEEFIDGTVIAGTDIPEPDPNSFDWSPDAIMSTEKGKFSASQVQSFEDAAKAMRAKTGGMWDGIDVKMVSGDTFKKMVSSYMQDVVKEVFGFSGPEIVKIADDAANRALAVFIQDPYSGAIYINGDKLNSAWLSQNGGGLVDNTLSGALLHEVGHAAGFNTLAGNTMDWCNLSTSGLGCTTGNNGQIIPTAKPFVSVSQYGTNSVGEDFAETYVSYFATGGNAALLTTTYGSPMTLTNYQNVIQAKFNYMKRMGAVDIPSLPK